MTHRTIPPFPAGESLRQRLRLALAEDLGEAGDVTSQAVFPAEHRSRARIVAKAHGILAGGPIIREVFGLHDPSVRVESLVSDGSAIDTGDVVSRLTGPTR